MYLLKVNYYPEYVCFKVSAMGYRVYIDVRHLDYSALDRLKRMSHHNYVYVDTYQEAINAVNQHIKKMEMQIDYLLPRWVISE